MKCFDLSEVKMITKEIIMSKNFDIVLTKNVRELSWMSHNVSFDSFL